MRAEKRMLDAHSVLIELARTHNIVSNLNRYYKSLNGTLSYPYDEKMEYAYEQVAESTLEIIRNLGFAQEEDFAMVDAESTLAEGVNYPRIEIIEKAFAWGEVEP